MRGIFLTIIGVCLLLGGCGEYTKVLKSRDVDYKYAYAKKPYDQKKYLPDTYTQLTLPTICRF